MTTALALTRDCTRCTTPLEAHDLRCAVCALTAPVQEEKSAHQSATLIRCDHCGATMRYTAEARAPRCAFCDSVMHLETPEDPPEEPEAFLPFTVEPDTAKKAVKAWLGKQGFFRPSNLQGAAVLESVRPLWWVGWSVDARAKVSWMADSNAGTGRADWAPHSGQAHLAFRNVLVPGSRGLTPAECRELGGRYDLATARATPEGPAGALQESFDIARSAARRNIIEALESAAAHEVKRAHIPGTRHRKVSAALLLEGLNTRRLALPAYVLAYRYKDKPYRAVVHGQEVDCVIGSAPLSWAKVAAVVGVVLAIAATAIFLASL